MTTEIFTNVFTYGSLMYPQVIGKLVRKQYLTQKALLRDFQRRHVKNAVYPGVIRCLGKEVMGVIYYDVDKEDLAALDYFESSEYEKAQVEVETAEGKKVRGVVYCYKNESNLQDCEWKIQDFEKNYLHTFADSHSQKNQQSQ